MFNVQFSGQRVELWCVTREDRIAFKVGIGANNDISDLKTIIKEFRKPRYDKFSPDELNIWKVNITMNRIKDIPIDEYLNEKLKDPSQKVRNTFYNIEGDNIRVVVGIPSKL